MSTKQMESFGVHLKEGKYTVKEGYDLMYSPWNSGGLALEACLEDQTTTQSYMPSFDNSQ